MQLIKDWFQRYFSDPQVVILLLFVLIAFAIVIFFGEMLAPVLASIVIAYLLHSLVRKMEVLQVPRVAAVMIAFLLFIAVLTFVLVVLLPLLSQQISQLVNALPKIIAKGHELLKLLPEKYPNFVTEVQVNGIIDQLQKELAALGQKVVSISLTSVVSLITLGVYLVLMPLLVFFFLKDKEKILGWFRSFFPREIGLSNRVWHDVDRQIGNYVRGKMFEVLIVWVASYIAFAILRLEYAMLLAALVGLSVIIPYIGAVVVTIPVAVIAYYQWGWSADFAYLMAAYLVIQAIDGSVIVPVLFSEVVNLHPIAIIVAVLVFGGIWGFWGVFFAIPLATMVQAILTAIRPSNSSKKRSAELS
jgi:putative permease